MSITPDGTSRTSDGNIESLTDEKREAPPPLLAAVRLRVLRDELHRIGMAYRLDLSTERDEVALREMAKLWRIGVEVFRALDETRAAFSAGGATTAEEGERGRD